MVRHARKKSSTGIYHVMLRGIDKRDIFLDDEDRERFIERVINAKKLGNFEMYGYCLMDNHVHLLIREGEDIGNSIKRITVGYVAWHNNKHGRVGHLFQNRYLSEPVEGEGYLITVLRYIHQNPVKAGIVKEANDYSWSSYKQYLQAYQNENSSVDADLIKGYFKTFEDFRQYMNTPNSDECLEYKQLNKSTDTDLMKAINIDYNIEKLTDIPIKERNKLIREIYHNTGASIRQLERVIGVGKAIIEKAIRQDS